MLSESRIIIVLTILLCCFQGYAQLYGFRNYSLGQGLPQTEVYAMLQDSRKNIWVGTNGGGLARFNGINFKTYTISDGLLSNLIRALYEDSHGNIWIGTTDAVTVYDGISFRNYTEEKVPFLRTYTVFHEDTGGDIWVVSFDEQSGGRLLKIQNDSLIYYSQYFPELNENNPIVAAFPSPKNNTLYLSTTNGLYELRNNKITYSSVNKCNEFKTGFIVPAHYDREGVLWILRIQSRTDRDLFMLKNDSLAPFKTPQSTWWKGITRIYRDISNRLWLSNLGTGIAMIDLTSGKITQFDQRNGLPNDYVLNFLEDHEGNIWMGTQGGGIIQYSRNNFIAFNFENIINGDVVRTIFQDSYGNYWFGLSSAGIIRYDGSMFTAFSKERYPGIVNVRDIIELDNGRLLILTINGLYIYDGSSLSTANRQYGFSNQYQFSNAIKDGNTLWLATLGNGVFRYTNGIIDQLSIDNGNLPSNQVHSLFKDNKGNIWICTNNGLSRYNNGNITIYTTENGLNDIITLQITQDHFDRYWIATFSGGINILDGEHFSHFTTKDGLTSNIIYSILTDQKGNIWAGTQNGVDMISFDAFGNISSIQHYGIQDGFTGIENNGAANLVDREGNLWFGTVKGAMRYDPNIIEPNPVEPVVQITDIKLFFKDVDWRNSEYDDYRTDVRPWNNIPENLVFPFDSNHFSFAFEALSFMAPEKVNLKGLTRNGHLLQIKLKLFILKYHLVNMFFRSGV
jgi:ligand-binding sensor domain-containing protein